MSEIIDAAQRLWDIQVVDADDHPVGKVDDLELTVTDDGEPPYVSAVLCGPLAFGPRLGGRLGHWWTRTGEVFQPSERPEPVRIDFGLVDVGKVNLRVAVPDPDVVGSRRLELWLREHLIGRIPGGGS